MLKKSLFVYVLGVSLLSIEDTSAQSFSVDCLEEESALNYWRPVRETIRDNTHSPNQLALQLLSCLGSPNPELRDRIGFEVFTYWLRNEQLSTETIRDLLNALTENLQQSAQAESLRRSFSALILSEILRADNLSQFMNKEERTALLAITVITLSAETDYRGLVENIGWVHPIAHMADMLWRFTLHSAFDEEQARLVLEAVLSKARTSAASYAFNEGDRLARSVAVLIARETLPSSEIINWLDHFNSPTGSDSWFDSFASVEGMRELHNSKLFIRALSDQLKPEEIDGAIRSKLEELVASLTSIV